MNDPLFLLLLVGIPLLSQAASSQMRKHFVQFSSQPMELSGKQAAELMLRDFGIQDVRITCVDGQLTDHYDPANKTVNLSQVVYNEHNVAAVAVATHECGHAVQHAMSYPFLTLRTNMVPLLRISSFALPVVAFGGAGVSEMLGSRGVALLCLLGLGLPALFSLITLPVEFNASRRALTWLETTGIAAGEQHAGAKKALFWAAMTYVVSALAAIIQSLYFARVLFGRGRMR